jgi:hypothetical protein
MSLDTELLAETHEGIAQVEELLREIRERLPEVEPVLPPEEPAPPPVVPAKLPYSIACFLWNNARDTTCTFFSKAFDGKYRQDLLLFQKSMGCDAFNFDLINDDNWSEASLSGGQLWWNGISKRDVQLLPGEESIWIELLQIVNDLFPGGVAAWWANDGRNSINNEHHWDDGKVLEYMHRFLTTVGNVEYKGKPLVQEIVFKREFNDLSEMPITRINRLLPHIKGMMHPEQTLWVHCEVVNPAHFNELDWTHIDGMRTQAGGRTPAEVVQQHAAVVHATPSDKLIKFSEYTFNGFNEPEKGDALIQWGLAHLGDRFKGVECYATSPYKLSEPLRPPQAADGFSWSKVDFINPTHARVVNFTEDATLEDVRIHRGSYWGPETWYANIVATGTDKWTPYKPYGRPEDRDISGNQFILVPQGVDGVPGVQGRWWAAFFEGYNIKTNGLHVFGNLNFEHTNVLAGTVLAYPWQPLPGREYGFFLTTDVQFGSGNGTSRTNPVFKTWAS